MGVQVLVSGNFGCEHARTQFELKPGDLGSITQVMNHRMLNSRISPLIGNDQVWGRKCTLLATSQITRKPNSLSGLSGRRQIFQEVRKTSSRKTCSTASFWDPVKSIRI